MKKYELTEETKIVKGKTLHRIRALKSFGRVKKGDLGGFVECDARICDYVEVFENGHVTSNTWVLEHAKVYGSACLMENSCIYGNAIIRGAAIVCQRARVFDNVIVEDCALLKRGLQC